MSAAAACLPPLVPHPADPGCCRCRAGSTRAPRSPGLQQQAVRVGGLRGCGAIRAMQRGVGCWIAGCGEWIAGAGAWLAGAGCWRALCGCWARTCLAGGAQIRSQVESQGLAQPCHGGGVKLLLAAKLQNFLAGAARGTKLGGWVKLLAAAAVPRHQTRRRRPRSAQQAAGEGRAASGPGALAAGMRRACRPPPPPHPHPGGAAASPDRPQAMRPKPGARLLARDQVLGAGLSAGG